ncbi:MAG: UDP-galactopyranose mutase, partial [Erysipelotrichaceae bacterium]|nr:UDP-galactopyranose mutase [Erysipelotrichaceae bacterium]
TRIIEHKHFNKFNKSEKTIISKEYPLPASETSEPYYPINDDRNMNLVKKYLEEKEKYPNIYLGGRLGLYKYLDMDDVIELALNQIEKLI